MNGSAGDSGMEDGDSVKAGNSLTDAKLALGKKLLQGFSVQDGVGLDGQVPLQIIKFKDSEDGPGGKGT